MVKILENNTDGYAGFKIIGEVDSDDIKRVEPILSNIIDKKGKVNFLIDITEYKKQSIQNFSNDIKLAIKHRSDINRISIVGDKIWQKLIANFGYLYFPGQRYFDIGEIEKAWEWVKQN